MLNTSLAGSIIQMIVEYSTGGIYTCTVTNPIGSDSYIITVNVGKEAALIVICSIVTIVLYLTLLVQ